MKPLMIVVLTLLGGFAVAPSHAQLQIFACEPEWGSLAKEIGGNDVSVFNATTAKQDAHHVEARPGLIAKLRQADLVVCTGAELEVGWMPMLLRQAGNAKVQTNQPGYFEAASFVERLEIPQQVDRSMGDIHAAGNPHIHTDPRRIAIVASKLAERLAQIDPPNAAAYQTRQDAFAKRWQQAIQAWSAKAEPLKGVRFASHHREWVYLYDWLGIQDAGTLEPKPGVPPTASHLATLKDALARAPARAVIRSPFEDPRPSEWLARETGTHAVLLPYTVGGTPVATDLFTLFDETIALLMGAST